MAAGGEPAAEFDDDGFISTSIPFWRSGGRGGFCILGVKQLSKAGILGKILEIGVVPSLEAEVVVQADGVVQKAKRILVA